MNILKVKISALEEVAKQRPAGYKEEVMSKGVVEGEWLHVPAHEYAILVKKYSPNTYQSLRLASSFNSCCGKKVNTPNKTTHIKGLGSLIAIPAQAIAKGIDKVLGTNVQNCGGCKQRQDKLDKLIPFEPSEGNAS